MEHRGGAVLLCMLLLSSLNLQVWAAHEPDVVGIKGIPICPAGLPACGLHGCYTPLLTRCDTNNGCVSVKILTQLSALVRFGSTTGTETAGACPIPFANACGNQFCAMGEVCSGGVCTTHGSQPTYSMVGQSFSAAKAACQAARHGSGLCAGDTSEMVGVGCNQIGIAAITGVYCFQSQLFNCAAQLGGSATYTCRGIAGVAQAVTEVLNSTLGTAAAVAAEVAEALVKQEQQQLQQVEQNSTSAAGNVRVSVSSVGADKGSADGAGSTTGHSGSISTQAWRAGANAAIGTLSQAVLDKGQPLLQPIFQNLADMVNNASKTLLNITSESGSTGSFIGNKSLPSLSRQSTFNLGPPPIKDAAGVLPGDQMSVLLLVAMLSTLLLASI